MTAERTLIVGERSVAYSIVRSDRTTIAVTVARDGAVRVRAPKWLPERRIARFVEDRAAWIARKRAEAAERAACSAGPLEAAELADARRLLGERLRVCWEVFARDGEMAPPLRVRPMRSRWGSLTGSGTISLNAFLVRTPTECIDYVVFHELCHLRVRGHGAPFYAELAQYVPEWKRLRRQLREHPV